MDNDDDDNDTTTYDLASHRFTYYRSSGGVVVTLRGIAVDAAAEVRPAGAPMSNDELGRWARGWVVDAGTSGLGGMLRYDDERRARAAQWKRDWRAKKRATDPKK